jgi:hypothetical protein
MNATTVYVNLYKLLDRAVSEGVSYGVRRAFKHLEHPDEATIEEHVEREVMNAICEVMVFSDDDT